MKTIFNDSRGNNITYYAECGSCRGGFEITVDHYPHSLAILRYCPMCKDELINITEQEEQDIPHSYDCDCLEHSKITTIGFTDSETTSKE